MKYLSIKEMSEKWGISTRRIQILCKEGRIPGIIMIAAPGEYRRMRKNRRTQGSRAGNTGNCKDNNFSHNKQRKEE